MKRRSIVLVAVLAFGAGVLAIIFRTGSEDEALAEALPKPSTRPSIPGPVAEDRGQRDASTAGESMDSLGQKTHASDQNAGDIVIRYASASASTARQRAAAMSEAEARALCAALFQRRQQREKERRNAEPVDQAWAYPAEQKLHEWFAHSAELAQFDVLSIQCKTTFCEITARSAGSESAASFAKSVETLKQQSWSSFGGYELSHPDRTHFARLQRGQGSTSAARWPGDDAGDDVEVRADAVCRAWNMLKLERAQAARDAEPKDQGWAQSMELLLREYFTERMTRGSLDHLDIDCRTTFCTITGGGHTQQSHLTFQKVSQAVPKESWNDFLVEGMSGSATGEIWTGELRLRRRRP